MTVSLANFRLAVCARGYRICFQLAFPGTQTHRATKFINTFEFSQFVDDSVGSTRIEFARIGVVQSANIARELDAGSLHAEANTEVRDLIFARIPNCIQHAGNATLAETPRNQNAVVAFKLCLVGTIIAVAALESLSFYPSNVQLETLPDCRMGKSFVQGFIGVLIFDVFPDDCDRHLLLALI